MAHLGIILGSILEAFWKPREYFWYIGTISGRFWSLSKPERHLGGAPESSECPRDRFGHTCVTLWGRGGGPDWKVSQPQGEDNRRGTDTSHTPDDPKGSADFLQMLRGKHAHTPAYNIIQCLRPYPPPCLPVLCAPNLFPHCVCQGGPGNNIHCYFYEAGTLPVERHPQK